MTSKVQLRRSSVPGKVPTTDQIDLGELAINTRDGKLYLKRDNGNGTFTIVDLGAVRSVAGRSGDVTLTAADVGLGEVNNTSDMDKPISWAQLFALAVKVGTERQVATGAGLTGGGALNADRTIAADIASQEEAEAGAADDKLMSALSVEQHMTANVLGWGQNYVRVNGNGNDVRQNLTGRPILLSIFDYSTTNIYVRRIGTSPWLLVARCRYSTTATAIIPDGWEYYWDESVDWAVELR